MTTGLSERTQQIVAWIAGDELEGRDEDSQELINAIRELGEERSDLRAENERLRAALGRARKSLGQLDAWERDECVMAALAAIDAALAASPASATDWRRLCSEHIDALACDSWQRIKDSQNAMEDAVRREREKEGKANA